MIDWVYLIANSLWILGCAVVLATLSYASWQASLYQESLRARLERVGIQRALHLSGLLFCAGLAILSEGYIKTLLWATLGVSFAMGLVMALRRTDGAEEKAPGQPCD